MSPVRHPVPGTQGETIFEALIPPSTLVNFEPDDVVFPYVSKSGRAVWDSPTRGRIWVVVLPDPDDPDWLEIELDCAAPPPNHCMRYELDAVSLFELVFPNHNQSGSGVAKELLEKGIAPGQPFQIDLRFSYLGPDHNDEYDSECDWTLVQVEPWTEDQVVTAWEAWLARQFIS